MKDIIILKFFTQKFSNLKLEVVFKEYTWNRNKKLIRFMIFLFIIYFIWTIINSYVILQSQTDWFAYVTRFVFHLPSLLILTVLAILGPLKSSVRRTLWYIVLSFYSIYIALITDLRTLFCLLQVISTNCSLAERPTLVNTDFYAIIGPYIMLLILLNNRGCQLAAFCIYITIHIILFGLTGIIANVQPWLSMVILIGGYTLALLISYTHEKQIRQSFQLQQSLKYENEEKQLAEELQKKSELEKDAFVSYIFHEIRVPLNIVKLSTNLLDLDETFFQSLNFEECDYYDKMKISINSMESVLNETVDYNSLYQGQIAMENIPFNILNAFENMLWTMEGIWKEKNINFQKFYDKNLEGKMVLGDENRLRQATTNYLSNAIKFTNENGLIVFNINIVSETEDSITIHVSVKDSGIGISTENQQKLFKPYVQIDPQKNQSGKGTGLGLSIVSNIISLMHGNYGLESEIGQGSTFWYTVTLPKSQMIKTNNNNNNNNIENDKVNKTKFKLFCLIVDDDRTTRELVMRIFEKLGHSSDFAVDGLDCIEKCENNKHSVQRYDLIIIDNLMPRMTGREAIHWLREHDYTLPIISFTATSNISEKQELLNVGANYVLSKPSSIANIQKIINILIQEGKFNNTAI